MYVYILKCSDNTYYTGFTSDLERRLAEHQSGSPKCAKYTISRRPVELIWSLGNIATRSQACSIEYAIKKLTRKQKEALIQGDRKTYEKVFGKKKELL